MKNIIISLSVAGMIITGSCDKYEKADLVAFMKSLTDSEFIHDKRFDRTVYK